MVVAVLAVTTQSAAARDWLAGAPAARAALSAHADKLAAEFRSRLRYAQPDGRLRVMVTTNGRSPATTRLVAAATTWVRWYPGLPAFFAAVTPAQLTRLLASSAVRFVEPDYPITYNLSVSARDVAARGGDLRPGGAAVAGDHRVSLASPTATWEGHAPGSVVGLSNIMIDFAGLSRVCEPPECDSVTLGVADRGNLSFATSSTDNDWVDLEVIEPDGTVRFRSGSTPTVPLKIADASPGTYTVHAWSNATIGISEGQYRVTATLQPSSETPAMWRFDPTAGALGKLVSAAAGIDVDRATGKGVTVAIIDGGIDKTHPDFGGFSCAAGAYAGCESRVTKTITIDHVAGMGADIGDMLPTSDVAGGHGTHVAGIVAGNGYAARAAAAAGTKPPRGVGVPMGIAPQASLVSIKNGETVSAALGTYGLSWLAANAKTLGVRVSNNSWGCLNGCAFNGASATALSLKALYQAGVLTVFAAGNGGGGPDGAAYSGNAQSPYVLGVANYDAVTHVLSSDSSRGSSDAWSPDPETWRPEAEPADGYRRPDLAAPGMYIWSTRSLTGGAASTVPRVDGGDVPASPAKGGTGSYVSMSGTSMAAPHVAGAAAVLFSACPKATVLDAMRALMASADPARVLAAEDGTTWAQPFEAGYGGLDVAAAVAWLRAHVTACG
jgi:serine protease AprX